MSDVLIALMRKAMECWVDGKEWQAAGLKSMDAVRQCGHMCQFNPDKGV